MDSPAERDSPRPIGAAVWALRLAVGLCFVGHGYWGLVRKAGWLPFFHAFSIPDDTALTLMPLIGAADIAVGILVFLSPNKLGLAWMTVWALWTALLRPIAGMGWWEFLERGGNCGPPLALLLVGFSVHPGFGNWLSGFAPRSLAQEKLEPPIRVLRLSIALLLIGHGGFALFQGKPMLLEHLAAVGIGDGSAAALPLLRAQGVFEIALGLSVLAWPARKAWRGFTVLLSGVIVWKVATELLYPIANPGPDLFEFIERSGDYFAPLALIYMVRAVR